MTNPNVSFIRPELKKLLPLYQLIRDCLGGETVVKEQGTKYLPKPSPEDNSTENNARYRAYKERAVFYNVTRRTFFGLLGQVFMRDPIVKLPSLLKKVEENASGTGVSLTQLAKKATGVTLAFSRAGVFIDYPETEEGEAASVADLESGKIRPTIAVYEPQQILNWRVIDSGAEEIISLVVLAEPFISKDDGFEIEMSWQIRVLKLDAEGNYIQEIWREPQATKYVEGKQPKGNFALVKTIVPKDASGQPLKEIPFKFIGSEDNDTEPESPNFYDMASLNIAHYRNSADYEESCFIVGQPTPVLTGLTEEWVKDVLKGVVAFGSRGGIPLPVGGAAELLQAEPNTMIKEAMDAKERQMVALGAKLVQEKSVQRTAFEAKLESTGEGSVLSSTAKNVSEAFKWALKWCAAFIGQSDTAIEFQLNTDFDIARMTPEERSQVIKEWQAGALTFDEMRNSLRKAGVATENDTTAKAKIAKDTAEAMALESVANVPGGGE